MLMSWSFFCSAKRINDIKEEEKLTQVMFENCGIKGGKKTQSKIRLVHCGYMRCFVSIS